MRVVALVNCAAGISASQARCEGDAVRAAFERAGVDGVVREAPAADFRAAAREAADEGDVLVVGGGDGTVSAGAAAAVAAGRPLGILPLGTLNHFARDLGLPLDLDGAVRVIAAGAERRVDVGEADGRVFVNNASIGLYPAAVEDRERMRTGGAFGRWRAMARAAAVTLRRLPVSRVTLRMLGGSVRLTTPLVVVGNNRYDVRLFTLGRRPCLDAGELWLYVARDGGRAGVAGLAARALLGRLDQARDFLGMSVSEVEVEDRRRRMPVALDGEVCDLPSPLRFATRPGALRVLAPPRP